MSRILPVVTVIAALLAATPAGAAHRATTDLPDDFRGPQIHLVYAIPSDGPDRGLDTGGNIAQTAANFSAWLRGQTGGRSLRYDTASGAMDVTFVRLLATDATLLAKGVSLRDELERQLHALGFNAREKLYEVFYDGPSPGPGFCGGAAWPPALAGNVVAQYLNGAPPGAPSCLSQPLPTDDGTPGYWGFGSGHEILHALGLAPTCAPHHTRSGHTSDSPTDLMYAGDEGWSPSVLDTGHDDYFEAGIPGCPSLDHSAFFDGGTQMPPSWPGAVGTGLPLAAPTAPPTPPAVPDGYRCGLLAGRHSAAAQKLRAARRALKRARGAGRARKLKSYRHWQRVERQTLRRFEAVCR